LKFGIEFKTLSGNKLSFLAEDKLLIGRSSACNVVLQEEGISRRHCLIEHRDEDFYITDLESVNGVIVDDTKLSRGETVRFLLSSKLFLGPIEVTNLEVYDGTRLIKMQQSIVEADDTEKNHTPIRRVRESKRTAIIRETKMDKSALHPSLKAMLVLIMLGFLYGSYVLIFSEENVDLDRILFESSLKNKKADGSVKTINF